MSGYGSDDELPHRRPVNGYGSLPGDRPSRLQLSKQQVQEYQSRQASSGPSTKKLHFIDAVVGTSARLSLAQTKARDPLERHRQLLAWLPPQKARTDADILREAHRFLREEDDDDGSWEASLAGRYYDRLFKEYVICDLTGYRQGMFGFRWRTEAEVVQGKGQFFCGHKPCSSRDGLCSYEVDFKYKEASKRKRALVKARLCEACAYKLHYRRLKDDWKKRAGLSSSASKKTKTDDRGSTQEACAEDATVDGPVEFSSTTRLESENSGEDDQPTSEERKQLEALAWRGPDPAQRTRGEEMDDYFNDLLL